MLLNLLCIEISFCLDVIVMKLCGRSGDWHPRAQEHRQAAVGKGVVVGVSHHLRRHLHRSHPLQHLLPWLPTH